MATLITYVNYIGEIIMTDLQIFNFRRNDVRTVLIDSDVWFVGKDVCDILELSSNTSQAYSRLKDYEKLTYTLYGSGQNREFTVISESGLYRLVVTSRKPQAEPFQDWICQEVIPNVRKTGFYSIEKLSPAQQIIKMGESMLALEEEQARQAKQLEETTQTANEAKEGLEEVRNEIASLKEFAVAQPEGLDQDQAQLINEAFQKLGKVLQQNGVKQPDCYKQPWNDLGLKMRNSISKYDLNARFSNALKKYKQDLNTWEANGKPRGQRPKKPTRISILIRDNKLTDAFNGAQQVVKSYLSQILS